MWNRRFSLVLVGVIVLLPCLGYANEEITVDLPGGATMQMVWVEPGTFMMGTTEEQGLTLGGKGLLVHQPWWGEWFENEKPIHQVTISRGFYLGKYEITQLQWEKVMNAQPWSGRDYVLESPECAAGYISWIDVQEFIGRLNAAEGEEVYRLPTEAEWEYACRAGTNTLWSYGDDEHLLTDYAWYRSNAWLAGMQYPHPVGTKLPNAWGLFDMLGNVKEWCQDWRPGVYTGEPQIDPMGPSSGESRIFRGGTVIDDPSVVRPAVRDGDTPDYRTGIVGARLVRIGPKVTAVTPQGWGQVKKGLQYQ